MLDSDYMTFLGIEKNGMDFSERIAKTQGIACGIDKKI